MAQTLSIRKYYIVIYQSTWLSFFSLGTPTEPISSAERHVFKIINLFANRQVFSEIFKDFVVKFSVRILVFTLGNIFLAFLPIS